MSEKNSKLEKISFFDVESNEEVELYVIEQTTLKENKYLLVAEEDSDESEAYIFKEVKEDDKAHLQNLPPKRQIWMASQL